MTIPFDRMQIEDRLVTRGQLPDQPGKFFRAKRHFRVVGRYGMECTVGKEQFGLIPAILF